MAAKKCYYYGYEKRSVRCPVCRADHDEDCPYADDVPSGSPIGGVKLPGVCSDDEVCEACQ